MAQRKYLIPTSFPLSHYFSFMNHYGLAVFHFFAYLCNQLMYVKQSARCDIKTMNIYLKPKDQ